MFAFRSTYLRLCWPRVYPDMQLHIRKKINQCLSPYDNFIGPDLLAGYKGDTDGTQWNYLHIFLLSNWILTIVKMSDDASPAPAKRGRKANSATADKAEKNDKPVESKKRAKKVNKEKYLLMLLFYASSQ
nr:unnamed protein product [Callosobruchus analis]